MVMAPMVMAGTVATVVVATPLAPERAPQRGKTSRAPPPLLLRLLLLLLLLLLTLRRQVP